MNGDLIPPRDITTRLDLPYEAGAEGDWASTGDKVVYSDFVGDPKYLNLHVVDLNDISSGPVVITNLEHDVKWPEWSPDDTQIVTGYGDLTVFDVATGAWRTILPQKGRRGGHGDPTWRPDR